jgi:hypothetical protein
MTAASNGRGPGRPRGALNKRSLEVLEKVEATGVTPLNVMLEAMRHHFSKWETLKAKKPNEAELSLSVAAEFAKSAAPYLHPRLSSTVLTGKDGSPLVPDRIPLDAIRQLLAEDDAETERRGG